jgi:hypothetical protein
VSIGWPDFTQVGLQYLQLDELVQDNTTVLAPSHSFDCNQRHSYAGLLVSVSPGTPCNVTVLAFDSSGAGPNWTQRKAAAGSGATVTFFTPYPVQGINSATVQITCSVNQAGGSNVQIYGVSLPLPAAQGQRILRADGRDYPLGTIAANSFTVAAGTTPLIAAPGAGLRILLGSISLNYNGAGGAGNGGAIIATVNGASPSLITTSISGIVPNPIPPGGVLCDANTAVTLSQSGAGVVAGTAIYDIVL